MIPKVIHYCWFGRNPLPKLAHKCIELWRKYLPDYEIKEWNEDNFDVNMIPYVAQAYKAGKYAFVSDYARFWIVYKYGGVYFDTDVEVLKPMQEIIDRGPFLGSENYIYKSGDRLNVNPGLGLACEAGNSLFGELMNLYHDHDFTLHDGNVFVTIVKITSDLLYGKGLKSINEVQQIQGVTIYPADYFAPRQTIDQNIPFTSNSYSMHHYANSWMPWPVKLYRWFRDLVPLPLARKIAAIKHRLKK